MVRSIPRQKRKFSWNPCGTAKYSLYPIPAKLFFIVCFPRLPC